MVNGFSMVLYNYTNDEITKAFMEWMREKSQLPTPSDILAICNVHKKHKSDFDPSLVAARDAAAKRERERIENLKTSKDMPAEEFDQWLQKAKATLQPEKKKRTRGKIDTSHFDRLSPEHQKELYDYANAADKIFNKDN